jgi:hypothetical protein
LFLEIIKAILFWPIFFPKTLTGFWPIFIPSWPQFFTRLGRINYFLSFFLKLRSLDLRSTRQVSLDFITKIIIILLISKININ